MHLDPNGSGHLKRFAKAFCVYTQEGHQHSATASCRRLYTYSTIGTEGSYIVQVTSPSRPIFEERISFEV